MTQVTLDLDDELLARVIEAAEAAGLSLDAWFAGLIQEWLDRG